MLAYVWTQEGLLFNEDLAALGLAQYNDYGQRRQYSARVAAAAQQARAAGIGMWGACALE
jgi:endonuclease YncB( thermonuclease family)